MTVCVVRTNHYVSMEMANVELPDSLTVAQVKEKLESMLENGALGADFSGPESPEWECSGYSFSVDDLKDEHQLDYEDD